MTTTEATSLARERPMWKTVALPSEHGGWGLTLEPVLLGLVVASSVAGAALSLAALFAFLIRTPLKLVLIDAKRDRWLDRSRLALRVTLAESVVLALLVVFAVRAAGWWWLVPVAVAAPLVAVELWFDVRSRGRRLIPQLCGAGGIAAVAAAIVLAAGRSANLAAGVWLILAARSIGAIPFVRVQIVRLRRGVGKTASSDVMQALAVAMGVVAVAVDRRMLAGLGGLVLLAVVQVVLVRRPPAAAKALGLCQMMFGVGLVAVTAIGALMS